ncbi:translational GTPase TypA [Candidatus Cerribacteria bacterium 'Amazon FNV 2010 28 9']|uniref:50S ribosomal subunit assembly factor BipA n=1 Tax=Candidatus Cerribacteria bacterium 'Amazon FNV 2010 28 9' TaxID=2081795 RepID=A0A317JSE2_9BACT|nr:MAG: translational GTPase TypA [Candidatus Cerribacteria bacterium 'Amazon FNV 2010 28 9']
MQDIRNIAIIAHVDHGKTTLVDGLLKQTHTFRDNQAEMQQTTILDSNDLEREKGITILAKNTAVMYGDTKINIIDTPGHADFGGEVERIINMADGAILLVDAAEGPLPQTKFVLQQALKRRLKLIVVVNKIDKKDADPTGVLHQIENLFLSLVDDESLLEFPVIYAIGRDGKAWHELPSREEMDQPGDLRPLFEQILTTVPSARGDDAAPFQLLISTLERDSYLGKLCIGRINRGIINTGDRVKLVTPEGELGSYAVEKLFVSQGIEKIPVTQAVSGDIVAIAGIKELSIGQTVCNPAHPEALPTIKVTEPTLKITIGPNTSPLAGREGKFLTSRQISERLLKEKETNLGLKIEEQSDGVGFIVSGRGELHLAVLIETMRREGYELEVSKPQVIYKEENGVKMEPFDEVTIDVPDEFVGVIQTELGQRKAMLKELTPNGRGDTRLIFEISERNLLGARTSLLTDTRGTLQMSSIFLEYRPIASEFARLRNGVLIASEAGKSASFGLDNAQQRGTLFIGAGEETYMGMIVGLNSREQDMEVNVNKVKPSTNVRSATKDMMVKLTPPVRYSLEQSLDFLDDDELLEVVPSVLRLRKKFLSPSDRAKMKKKE